MSEKMKTSSAGTEEVKAHGCVRARMRQVIEVQAERGGQMAVEYWSPEGELLAGWDETMVPDGTDLYDYFRRFRTGQGE